jgi:hypothetical protein
MLVGIIRVYCRVCPLIGQQNNCGVVGSVEEENISLITPSKNGKELKKTFTCNKVFGPYATQGWFFCCPFSSKVTKMTKNLQSNRCFYHFLKYMHNQAYNFSGVWLLYSLCLLHVWLMLFMCTSRGGFLRYATSDSYSFGWIQCLYICLQPDRVSKNTHTTVRLRESDNNVSPSFVSLSKLLELL